MPLGGRGGVGKDSLQAFDRPCKNSKEGKLDCVLTLFLTSIFKMSPIARPRRKEDMYVSKTKLGLVAEGILVGNWAGSRPGFAPNRLCDLRTVNFPC